MKSSSLAFKILFSIYLSSISRVSMERFPYAVLLLGCALLIAAPLRFRIKARHPFSGPHPFFCLDLVFLFGLFGIRMALSLSSRKLYALLGNHPLSLAPIARTISKALSFARRSQDRQELPPGRSSPSSPFLQRVGELLRRSRPFLRPSLTLLRNAADALKLKRLAIQGSFGLEDPARTGMIFGYLQVLRNFLGSRFHLDLHPDFTESGIRGRIDLVVHVYPAYLLILLIRFLLQSALRWSVLRFAGSKWRPSCP